MVAPEFPPELIEQVKARSTKLQVIDRMLKLEAELRSSEGLLAAIAFANAQKEEAVVEFANANPADTKEIMRLQAAVYRATTLAGIIDAIIQAGKEAEASLTEEDVSYSLQQQEQSFG